MNDKDFITIAEVKDFKDRAIYLEQLLDNKDLTSKKFKTACCEFKKSLRNVTQKMINIIDDHCMER